MPHKFNADRRAKIPKGIANLFGGPRVGPEARISGGHLKGVVAPQVMGIGPGMAIGVGGKLIAAGAEESVDLVVGVEEPLRLPGRLEPAHQFLTLAGRAV